MIPKIKPGGRPRSVNIREVVNAIFGSAMKVMIIAKVGTVAVVRAISDVELPNAIALLETSKMVESIMLNKDFYVAHTGDSLHLQPTKKVVARA